MAWNSGPVAKSLLRVREIQGSIPLKRTSFLNLVWMIETCCIINWHFEFIYKFCGHHSTLGKPPVPSSTIQQHGSMAASVAPVAPVASVHHFKALHNVLVFPLWDWFQQQLWICCPKPKAKAEKGRQGFPEEQPSLGRLKTWTLANIIPVSWLKGARGVLQSKTR